MLTLNLWQPFCLNLSSVVLMNVGHHARHTGELVLWSIFIPTYSIL